MLGALDDKIENNHKMNETLEEMARTIFKSWFVDFDPVHVKVSGNAPAHMDKETAFIQIHLAMMVCRLVGKRKIYQIFSILRGHSPGDTYNEEKEFLFGKVVGFWLQVS